MSAGASLLEAALEHHSRGCTVIAVKADKRPYQSGWSKYFTTRQSEDDIRQHFANGAHGAAMVLYPASPYVVLDFDGDHAMEAWAATGIELPPTARNITRGGGQHLYFKVPAGELPKLKRTVRVVSVECACSKFCGVDLLCHGYAIIPPTPNYTEDPDHPLEDAVTIPDEILALLTTAPKPRPQLTGDNAARVHEGQRNWTACSLAGTMRKRGMSVEAIRAALIVENRQRFEPPLPEAEIESILKQATKWEQGATITSEHFTDLGNARRLIMRYKHVLRYSSERGWLTWTGRRWEQDDTGAVIRYAKTTVCSIYAEAAACEDSDMREEIVSHARRSEAEARIRAMVTLARSEPEVVLRHDDLDRDPWLLNVANGTLNLKIGELQPHSCDHLITRLIPIDYDTEAVCPLWLTFLERVTGGSGDLIEFLQKALGYSLTGLTREQILLILYGLGANGKSTFLNTCLSLFADYGRQTGTETLLVKRGDQIPNDVARLAGARFVSAVETESGRRLAEGLVKQLTGGDRMTARFLHHEFFEFRPTFKLWLAANHKPRITGTDHAIWRRIRLVPFTETIPENERDPDLTEKLKEELPGILAWAVAGCLAWQAQGLKPPKAITAATDNYREESDILASFIGERCNVGADCKVSKAGLYEAYADWCEQSGERPLTKRDLGSRLLEKGFSDERDKKGRFWRGIELETGAG